MSFDYKELTKKYSHEAPFNKMTNLFRQLIEDYGFTPSEMRQGLFFAQYEFEMNNIKQCIRTNEEWQQLAYLHRDMQQKIVEDYPALSAAYASPNQTAEGT